MTCKKVVVFGAGQKIELEIMESFFQKLRGLLGVKFLEKNKGIILTRCKQVHTFGMKFSIDIVVLDRDFRVIGFVGDLKANKISPYYRKGYYIIELTANLYNKSLFKESNQLTFKLC